MPKVNPYTGIGEFNPATAALEHEVYYPFFHEPCPRGYIVLKTLLGLVLVPLRLICIFSVFVLLIGLLMLPLNARQCQIVTRIAARVQLFIVGIYRIDVAERARNDKDIAHVFNHTSPFDIPLAILTGTYSFVASDFVLKIPCVRCVAKQLEMIMIDRKSAASRLSVAQQIEDRCKNKGDRSALAVFPEGGTTNGRCLISFRTGIFRPGVAIQPVCLCYSAPFGTLAWDIQPGFLYMLDVLSRPYVRVKIIYLPVHYPTEAERADPILFADNVRARMAIALGVRTSNLTFKDKFRYEDYCYGRITAEEFLKSARSSN